MDDRPVQNLIGEILKPTREIFREMSQIKLWPIDQQILREMSRRNVTSVRDLFFSLRVDESFLYKRLNFLRENGLVEKAGWGKYKLTDVGEEVSKVLREVDNTISHVLGELLARK